MNNCQCASCIDAASDPNDWLSASSKQMILCEKCGNKRCSHATNHRNACTNSNEPGQAGSSYGPATTAKQEAS